MRVLLLIAALVLLFAVAGWVTFSNDSGRSSINLETNEIREDTGQLMHKGSEALKEAEQEVTPAPNDEPVTTRPSSP